ncbi:MAG: hypothetical protein ACFB02_11900 [Mastigocoleus sp.]
MAALGSYKWRFVIIPAERAIQGHTRAEQERARTEPLAAKLRELGIDPSQL